jgi:predicted Holliday junction resolvase-like endonuclease
MDSMFIPVIYIIGFAIFAAITNIVIERGLKNKYRLLEQKLQKEYEDKKKRSNDISRNVLRGQLLQQFTPFRHASVGNLNPYDMRFQGDYCDLICIDGYTDIKDTGEGKVRKVIFMEIKSGDAKLSKHQEAVKDAIDHGRVEWRTIIVPGDVNQW